MRSTFLQAPGCSISKYSILQEVDVSKILIIGGGVAGLSAGCYLQMNGYETEIFEMGKMPGGVCTAWKRGGYTFDGCIHWLIGSGKSSTFHELWEELHAVQGRKFVEYDEFLTYEKDGRVFTLYGDADKLEAEFMRFCPEDKKLVSELIGAIKKLSEFNMPVKIEQKMKFGEMMGMMSDMRLFMKWGGMSVRKFAEKLKGEFVRDLFLDMYCGNPEAEFSMIGFVLMAAGLHAKSGGYPVGGSLEFVRAIEKYYLELGGGIHYGETVSRIEVEDGRAVGIVSNGRNYPADVVISAADGYSTLYDMLGGRFTTRKLDKRYRTMKTFQPLVQVSMGVAKTFDVKAHQIVFQTDKPVTLDLPGSEQKRIGAVIYHFDPTLAPAGKTSVVVMAGTDNYQYWFDLAQNDRTKYETEKKRVADEVIAAMDGKFPGFAAAVEVVDVATPWTTYRYTHNWKASYEGWMPNSKNMLVRFKKTLPGLKNFYMIGQWTSPGGGLPPAAKDGRDVAYRICKADGKTFTVKE